MRKYNIEKVGNIKYWLKPLNNKILIDRKKDSICPNSGKVGFLPHLNWQQWQQTSTDTEQIISALRQPPAMQAARA